MRKQLLSCRYSCSDTEREYLSMTACRLLTVCSHSLSWCFLMREKALDSTILMSSQYSPETLSSSGEVATNSTVSDPSFAVCESGSESVGQQRLVADHSLTLNSKSATKGNALTHQTFSYSSVFATPGCKQFTLT